MFSSKKNFTKLPWKLLSIEAALVVFSVLLALAINSWRQSRSHQQLAQRALKGIVEEVERNCARMQSVHPYYQKVVNGQRQPGGLRIGFIRNQAWDAAKTIGAGPYIDYEIVAKVEDIYSWQSDHRSIVKSYVTALFTGILQKEEAEQGKKENPEGEKAAMKELVTIQEVLLEDYQELSTQVEERYGMSIDASNICKEN
ncbi:hypothetical protein [Fodinibius salsisoli]|uniref:Uncharacterized protein n=1 Tax=Fodinibius salsisoli TaxID=2820877 RepID=A0ABT3PSF4_9BACT|nr:hypothetical protein [Fodinibius salsisoli]MCW9708793.1 hypothetical protein [Fodinibius salsisoli]